MSGGSQQTSTQTMSGAPWKPSQGYLKGAMSDAQTLLDKGKGFKPFPGQGWVPFSSQTQSGLNTMQALAGKANPLTGNAMGFTKGLLGGQFNHDTSGYEDMLGGENEAYQQVRQNTANTLGDQIQRQFGGASYGAPENADYLTRGVGDVLARMDSDNYFQRQNLKRGLLGDMSNLAQMDIGNRMAGVDLMDPVYQSQFAPAERMLQVGGMHEAKAGEKLQAQMDKFNIKQMAPWDRLAQAFGIFSGTGAQGNRTTTSVSQPTDPWSKILGGGLLASQVFM